MNTNDETNYQGQEQNQQAEVNNAEQKKVAQWQKVTISGLSGIIIGAGAMFAANAMGANEEHEDAEVEPTGDNAEANSEQTSGSIGVQVAHVNDGMSFGEAFAAARAEVGPGGAFHWHGNTYSTYIKEEWDSMSDAEKQDYANRVAPELEQHTTKPNDVADHSHQPEGTSTIDQPEVKPVLDQPQEDEAEVHFLGVEKIESEDGSNLTVGHMQINDQQVALVDMTDDEVFDVAVSDRNHDGQITEDEVVDISDAGITVEQFAEASLYESGMGIDNSDAGLQTASQDGIGEGMPDYMNDADMQPS